MVTCNFVRCGSKTLVAATKIGDMYLLTFTPTAKFKVHGNYSHLVLDRK